MRWLAASVKTLLILLCAGALVFGSAHAANTIVTAMVCSPGVGSVITLSRPVSDSTVNSADITVSGRVARATALNVSVDGVLRRTITPSSLDASFNTVVTVAEGTHDIRLTATDICTINDGAAMAVITYIKAAVPTQGTSVPTVTNQTNVSSQRTIDQGSNSSSNNDAGVNQLHIPAKQSMNYSDSLVNGVIDESQPAKPVSSAPVIVAVPFVVGAGAFGWIHFRRFGH